MALLTFESLPEGSNQVECQLTWIHDFVPELETSGIKGLGSLVEHLDCLLKLKEKTVKEDTAWEEELIENSISDKVVAASRTAFAKLATKLNKVAFLTYIGEFEKAGEILEVVRIDLQSVEDSDDNCIEKQEGYLDSLKYCVDAAQWQINVLPKFKGGLSLDKKEQDRKEQLLGTWNTMTGASVKFRAAVEDFKGHLAQSLKAKWEAACRHFVNAAKMDSECYVWAHDAFWELRRLRRKDNVKSKPSKDELKFCRRAYQLCPDNPMIILDYALLLREEFWFKGNNFWRAHPDLIGKCIALFEHALEMVSNAEYITNKERRMMEIKIYIARVLLRTDEAENIEKGKELLEQFPESTKACHKLAKLYQYGTTVNGVKAVYRNFRKAEECYLKALRIDPSNYPCLMDFLKYLDYQSARRPYNYELMLSITDKFLEASKRDMLSVIVWAHRGCKLWFGNITSSCSTWIEAVLKFPAFMDKIVNVINAWIEEEKINRKEVNYMMVELRNQMVENDSEERGKIDEFIDQLRNRFGSQ